MPYDASFLQEFLRYLTSFFATHRDVAIFYFPLGVLGAWRWSTWLAKECLALFYHPKKPGFHAAVSIITPVYNEKPALLLKALGSWKRNDPAEIIAVIDHTDKACIQVFKKFQKNFPATSLIITKIPGKRPALAAGILAAKSPIVALVDSDTVWKKNVLFHALAPFKDPKVAGVGTRQNVLKPTSLAEKIFDMGLDLRYADEHSYLAAVGSTLTCISGRTAFYRRQALFTAAKLCSLSLMPWLTKNS
ncbi:MAG: glycosyltransferase [Candidatus Chisholmbacteria bacterium]|nr:glycosyltransferase [Candidatus Chisholmbacteria bacterium]